MHKVVESLTLRTTVCFNFGTHNYFAALQNYWCIMKKKCPYHSNYERSCPKFLILTCEKYEKF